MAILSEAETEACDRIPIKDGRDRFLDELEPKFSLADFRTILRSGKGKFERLHCWTRLTES